jgi:hypothetical protein
MSEGHTPEMQVIARYSEEGLVVEAQGVDVILRGEGSYLPEGARSYERASGPFQQLGKMLGHKVVILGPPLFEGQPFPPEYVRHLGKRYWRGG